jgi:hypothetical protein
MMSRHKIRANMDQCKIRKKSKKIFKPRLRFENRGGGVRFWVHQWKLQQIVIGGGGVVVQMRWWWWWGIAFANARREGD